MVLLLIIQDGLEQLHPPAVSCFRVMHVSALYDPLLLPETCRMTEPGPGVLVVDPGCKLYVVRT